MTYPTRTDVDSLFEHLGEKWDLTVSETPQGIEYEVLKDTKRVVFLWDAHRPEEFEFAFGSAGNFECTDWTEMWESERKESLFQYVEMVAMRYLENPTRLRRNWWVLGSHVLQYKNENGWHDVRSTT